MDYDDISCFIGKKVIINADFNSAKRYYTGFIVKLNDDSLLFKDKFDELVLIRFDAITSISQCKPENNNSKGADG